MINATQSTGMVAQAGIEELTLATADRRLAAYGVATLEVGA